MRWFLPLMMVTLIVASPSEQLSVPFAKNKSEDQDTIPGAMSISPFKITYYTDFYFGADNHKLFREVKGKLTGKRVHCTYVGDRQIIAGIIGDSNSTINEALQQVLPKGFESPVVNVTTDEVDKMIEECNAQPIDESGKLPGLKQFLNNMVGGAKNIASYLFIFPGTKWCGSGDVAKNYDDLGSKAATDRCCRDHDYSPESLAGGETKDNLTNPLFYTMTNCDYDNRFQQCLIDTNDAHAAAVGTMFFNILKTKCFAKRKQATCVKQIPLSPCQEYSYDESSKETNQLFDPKKFLPNSSVAVKKINEVLFTIPGIDNVINLF
ncbi:phospholipase A2-like [Tropilaelaps mercedesae]|uniref:Phospholipase A2 n=1 Tax=Tropilaelaps mercedesae TaxID=418985 RepID=A0A1V9XBG8_9ACAR|nr:phospholipase A2-like [Tropilaelaps mercedesae]